MGGTLKDLQGASAKLRRELAESGAERDEALMVKVLGGGMRGSPCRDAWSHPLIRRSIPWRRKPSVSNRWPKRRELDRGEVKGRHAFHEMYEEGDERGF